MLANLNNALLLSTSNRSEAAVGYATMDGDTSGGLSPIAGIDKAFLAGVAQVDGNDGPAGSLIRCRLSKVSTISNRLRSCDHQISTKPTKMI